MRLLVDRPVDRSYPRSTGPVDWDQMRAISCQSIDWAVDRAVPVRVVHTGRPGGRLGLSPSRQRATFSLFLTFDLFALSHPKKTLLLPLSPLALQFSISVKIFQI